MGVACWHLQATYVGLKNHLQQEWASLQRSTQDLGEDFVPVDKSLGEECPLNLFHPEEANMLGWSFTSLPVKQSRISPPEPNYNTQGIWMESCVTTGYLITAL